MNVVANLATYPPRRKRLRPVIEALAPQVERLNVVLNEYSDVPEELPSLPNVVPILPAEDLKDVGKFFPRTDGAEFVMLVDDDLNYPPDYVRASLARMAKLDVRRCIGGYHGTIYTKPRLGLSVRKVRRFLAYRPERLLDHRRTFHFWKALEKPVVVDQIGTGTAVLRAENMPRFEYMSDAMMFVDVRFSRWCHERDLARICLPRAAGWLTGETFEERIYDFTRQNAAHVLDEVASFAFKNPLTGSEPQSLP